MTRELRQLLAAAVLLAALLGLLGELGRVLRAPETVYPAPSAQDYCEGLPPVYGTDC